MEVRRHRERKTHFKGSDLCYGKKKTVLFPYYLLLNHFARSLFLASLSLGTKYPLAHSTDAKEHSQAHASVVQVAARRTEFQGGIRGCPRAHAG
jgi:hypothetical protein